MEFSIRALAPVDAKAGCLVLGVYKSGNGAAPAHSGAAQSADRAARGRLREVLSQGDLSGKAGSTLLLHRVAGLAAERVLLVGFGEPQELKGEHRVDANRRLPGG